MIKTHVSVIPLLYDINRVWHFGICVSNYCVTDAATGNKLTIGTPDVGYQYTHSWLTTSGVFLEFEVMACSDAHLLFTQIPGDPNSNSVEIILSGFSNTRSVGKKTPLDCSNIRSVDNSFC